MAQKPTALKKIILPLLCLGFTLAATSQTGFQKGYIVTTNGDSSSGYLKRNTYAELAHNVAFSSDSKGNNSVFYTTENLKAFAFNGGDVFEAVSYIDLSDSNEHKTEFGRLALEGYYNVYSLARQTTSGYLIKSVDTTYLLYDDVIDKGMERPQMHLGNYRNTLAFLARDCNKAQTDFTRINFSRQDITRVVKQLNDCNQSASIVHRHKEKLEKHLVVYAGAFAVKDAWEQISGGAEIRLRNTILSRKLSFVTGVHYSKTNDITRTFSYGTYLWTKHEYVTEVYSVPALLHYSFLERVVQPYMYFGFGAAYKKIGYKSKSTFDKGFQGAYRLSIIGGAGVEVYPIRNIAIKADWRYELLMQHPTIGIAFRL